MDEERALKRATTNYQSNGALWFVVAGFSRRYSHRTEAVQVVAAKREDAPQIGMQGERSTGPVGRSLAG